MSSKVTKGETTVHRDKSTGQYMKMREDGAFGDRGVAQFSTAWQ